MSYLAKQLEDDIRRIVREELLRIIQEDNRRTLEQHIKDELDFLDDFDPERFVIGNDGADDSRRDERRYLEQSRSGRVWALVEPVHGDWIEDEDGRVWEYGYDVDDHVWRWFEVDLNVYRPEGRRVERSQAGGDSPD